MHPPSAQPINPAGTTASPTSLTPESNLSPACLPLPIYLNTIPCPYLDPNPNPSPHLNPNPNLN